jgi:hypothetical protein
MIEVQITLALDTDEEAVVKALVSQLLQHARTLGFTPCVRDEGEEVDEFRN